MGKLIDSYNEIISHVRSINDRIKQIESEIKQKSADTLTDKTARILRLQEQLTKIDDYILRVKGFQELAKKNLDSQNVLTIEAPPGYRVNLNRLSSWSKMIDPMSSNDPYAQRVFAVAKCDEFFLEQKRREFSERIEQLESDKDTERSDELENLRRSLLLAQEELRQYALSPEISEFSKFVISENNKFRCKISPTSFAENGEFDEFIAPGAYAVPLNFAKEQRIFLKSIMEDYYDADGGRVLLPVEISNKHEYVMTITCAPSRRKDLDKALQNLILSSLNAAPAGMRKFIILDGVRFNASSIGSLRQLEGSFALEKIPRNPEQLTAALEQIVSSFADTDELIEQYDSLSEFNEKAEPAKRLPYKTIVIFGWQSAFEGRDRELAQRIMTNYERYGVSIICVSYRNSEMKVDSGKNEMPEYALQNAVHISRLQNSSSITSADGISQQFTWYSFSDELSKSYVDSLLSKKVGKVYIGNEYLKRYSLTEIPPYVREYKKIELPFGVDGKDEANSVSFENENFATYLVGASRSGKSTLIHTLIAGLIRNYHPDNVELWLADFKQLEFKRYINHLPPHIRYILLDESTELVFDLVDKLTNEMMERQKLFARLGVQRIDQVDTTSLDKPLPVIFVILDEFSIMSQSIADSPVYKLRLQNVLAKGAALGIKFLFSSQTFTTGVAGLTATARAQIQQRIAMKGSKEEISETLELSSNLKTEQVRNWMDALPPHYALVKFRSGADTLPQVKRYLVMYFKDYEPRDNMIKQIRDSMKPSEKYNPSDISSYVDKHPVLVDGNTFNAFDSDGLSQFISRKKNPETDDYCGDETFVIFGSPRLMERLKVSAVSSETRENFLLIARDAEQACAASVILSIIKSYRMQNIKVCIWTYEKNPLFRKYRKVFSDLGIEIVSGMGEICNQIRSLKTKIISGETENELIVLLGIDRICIDFDYVNNEIAPKDNSRIDVQSGEAKTEEDFRRLIIGNDFSTQWQPIEEQLVREGRTEVEISAARRENMRQFKSEYDYKAAEIKAKKMVEASDKTKPGAGEYNAKNDFDFVVKHGSRTGRHFLLHLTSLADLKSTGLRSEYFRYKMAFQLSVDDSRSLFNKRVAAALPEHICQFDDSLTSYSFRPYLHEDVEWDGWRVENGRVVDPYGEN